MRKTYTMLLALVLSVLGVASVNAANQLIDLDVRMFKAWDGFGADAKSVTPQSYVGKEDVVQDFACENNLGVALEQGGVVYGNTNVYYKWYANLTGTKKIYFEGTANTRIRVIMNRNQPGDPADTNKGSDPNGGSNVEKSVTIGADGKAELDASDLTFIHLNCIKIAWGSSGTIDKIQIAPTGWVSLIYNGNADESDNVENFPLSFDGPNNGDTANERPEIVADGKDDKGFMVTSFAEPTETWHTQFFFLSNEALAEGTKIRLSFDYRAEQAQEVTASAQGDPRAYNGNLEDLKFTATPDWAHFEWTHTVASGDIGNNGFKSIAFNLNEGKVGPNTFYFDNIVFEKFIPTFNAEFGNQAIQILFPYPTNVADLVKATGKTRLSFPADCATLKVNGQAAEVEFIEADANGSIYVFPTEDVILEDGDRVEVVFTNPADAALHVAYTDEGRDAIEIVEVTAEWNESLNEVMPASYEDPVLEKATPENGSFNLPNSLSEFTLTFDKDVDCAKLTAKIGKDALSKTPATGFAKEVKLTRTGADLPNGKITINVTNVLGRFSAEEYPVSFDLTYSIGVTDIDGEQPEVVYQSNFTKEGDNANGAGWKVNKDGATTSDGEVTDDGTNLQDANSNAGSRLMHEQTAFAADLLYVCQRESNPRCPNGVALYGVVEDYRLTLQAKDYHLTLAASKWDRDDVARTLLVQVLPLAAVDSDHGTVLDEDAVLVQERKDITPTKASKEAVTFDIVIPVKEAGDYVIRMVPGDKDGNPNGYADGVALGNVKVEFVPDVMGIMDIKALLTAMENAKTVRDDNSEDRYSGAAYDALVAKIGQYDGKETVMTAPSQFTTAVEELNAAAKAMSDHSALCKKYDTNLTEAQTLVAQYSEGKFSNHPLVAELVAAVAKYDGKVLKEDTELNEAVADLEKNVKIGKNMFTEGPSNNSNCGVKVLVDRIRQGAEALKNTFDFTDDDELIVAANNAITDDDELANAIKKTMTTLLYERLAGDAGDLFSEEETENGTVKNGPDMTVFVKNPNMYALLPSNGISLENTPGWEKINGNMGLFCDNPDTQSSWGDARNIEGLPEDCAFTVYQANTRAEQTITDLPAGNYIVTLYGTDWGNKKGTYDAETDTWSGVDAQGFVYVKTSDTPDVEEGAEEDRDLNFAATTTAFYAGQYQMNGAHEMEVEVKDGKLTIGMQFCSDSQYFFGDVKLRLVGPAEGVDYAAELQKLQTGVEAVKTAANSTVIYDLQGRRVAQPTKGLYIKNNRKVVVK